MTALRTAAVEAAFAETLQLDGPDPIEQELRYWHVPGAVVCAVQAGEVAWAKGYGTLAHGDDRPMRPDTLVQAASISKPFTSAAVLLSAEEGRIELDAPLNAQLTSWQLPLVDERWPQPTVRQLLNSTGGVNLHGARGYRRDEPLPPTRQLLEGEPPCDSERIFVDIEPGTRFRYSGGGYFVLQVLLEEVYDKPFAQILDALVLGPLGMADSTFEQPLPERFHDRAAIGHIYPDVPMPGGWNVLPMQAPSGLWTTVLDLPKFADALHRSITGREGALLRPESMRQMLTVGTPDGFYGLGLRLEADRTWFGHGGLNPGYFSWWVTSIETGDGLVVTTNSIDGRMFIRHLCHAFMKAYDWPDFLPQAS